ncbi:hypothetical protein [uncultured Paraglaciecola sp.]|uniref:hypothetical protein n=1 Tax=uncultured Paraglaciecola sp. TaxID=1765024 RepID=UPI002621A727|nr:hypothetical protein [uncultured Paraglaciecola sp.]
MSVGFKIISRDSIRLATVSATSAFPLRPIDNIKLDSKSDVWRATSLAEQTITATWTDAQSIAGVGIVFSNLIIGSTVLIKLYTNVADVSPVFQTDTLVVDFANTPPIGFPTLSLASTPFGGGNYFANFFIEQSAEKMEVVLTSPGNPDGSMEIARLVAGKVIGITNGADFGAIVSYDDNIVENRSDSGNLVSDTSPRSKKIEFDLGDLNPTDKAAMQTMKRVSGKSVPIFVSAQDLSPVLAEKNIFQIYGIINNDISITTVSYNKHAGNLSITEI